MITRNWGLELILGYSQHDVNAQGSDQAVLGQVIDTKILPPTLSLKYHF
jgi:outer membrane protein